MRSCPLYSDDDDGQDGNGEMYDDHPSVIPIKVFQWISALYK